MNAAHPQLPEPNYNVLPPRRATVVLDSPQLRAILGLADDEHIQSVRFHDGQGVLAITVDSPRLRPIGYAAGDDAYLPCWNIDPPLVKLPLSDHYEPQADKPYPLVIAFPSADGGEGQAVALQREDGVLRTARPIDQLGLDEEQQATVRHVCARYSVPRS